MSFDQPLLLEIQKGESKTLEFKQQLPKGQQIAKTLIAFANACKSAGSLSNSINHSWYGKPVLGLVCGATVNSFMEQFELDRATLNAHSTSLPITCSPKAEIKCLMRPETIIR